MSDNRWRWEGYGRVGGDGVITDWWGGIWKRYGNWWGRDTVEGDWFLERGIGWLRGAHGWWSGGESRSEGGGGWGTVARSDYWLLIELIRSWLLKTNFEQCDHAARLVFLGFRTYDGLLHSQSEVRSSCHTRKISDINWKLNWILTIDKKTAIDLILMNACRKRKSQRNRKKKKRRIPMRSTVRVDRREKEREEVRERRRVPLMRRKRLVSGLISHLFHGLSKSIQNMI